VISCQARLGWASTVHRVATFCADRRCRRNRAHTRNERRRVLHWARVWSKWASTNARTVSRRPANAFRIRANLRSSDFSSMIPRTGINGADLDEQEIDDPSIIKGTLSIRNTALRRTLDLNFAWQFNRRFSLNPRSIMPLAKTTRHRLMDRKLLSTHGRRTEPISDRRSPLAFAEASDFRAVSRSRVIPGAPLRRCGKEAPGRPEFERFPRGFSAATVVLWSRYQ
jgi:hypothetical protein